MLRQHTCDWLKQFTADPRSPIKHTRKAGAYALIINAETRILMTYCPRCGVKLIGGGKSMSRRQFICEHLLELSRKPGSSVRGGGEALEYWLLGRDSLMIRLFYCPLCGSKLPLQKNHMRFWKKSQVEMAELAKRFKNITTIDLALKHFGQPDVDRGPVVDYMYPKGKRTRIGYKRAMFYERLAKTVTVLVLKKLDGRVVVKFYPKEKTRKRKRRVEDS